MTRTPVNRTAARLAFALALACSFPAIAEDDISKVNGSIETSAGQRYGDLETVNGAVRVAENVQARDASTVNGSIHVESGARVDSLETVNGAIRLARDVQVAGNLETVNGDITVGIGSHVRGGITVERPQSWFQSAPKRRPRVVIGPDAEVSGPMEFRREVSLYVHRTARIGQVTGAEPVRFETETAPQD